MLLQNYNHMNRQPLSFPAGSIVNGRRGRPKCDISREKLEYLLNYHLSVPDIAMELSLRQKSYYEIAGPRLKDARTVEEWFSYPVDDYLDSLPYLQV